VRYLLLFFLLCGAQQALAEEATLFNLLTPRAADFEHEFFPYYAWALSVRGAWVCGKLPLEAFQGAAEKQSYERLKLIQKYNLSPDDLASITKMENQLVEKINANPNCDD
jgi:hypothetical protein